jgi:hypothetical protein
MAGAQLQAPAPDVTPEQMMTPLLEFRTVTVERAWAVPEMVGRLLLVKELLGGEVMTGADGATVITVKVTGAESGLTLPARSVARATMV